MIGSDTVRALKSEGKHFKYGLKKLEVKPENAISVGDNYSQDIEPAKKLGIKTVSCMYGKDMTYYHSEHISNNNIQGEADFTINNLLEIKKLI